MSTVTESPPESTGHVAVSELQPESAEPTEAELAAVKAKSEPRGYVVLQKAAQASPSASQSWTFLRNIDALSAEQAVRKTAEVLFAAGEEGPVTLVAVVAARFRPVTVAVETKAQLKLS